MKEAGMRSESLHHTCYHHSPLINEQANFLRLHLLTDRWEDGRDGGKEGRREGGKEGRREEGEEGTRVGWKASNMSGKIIKVSAIK